MADFEPFNGSEEENVEIRKLNAEIDADPDNFDAWQKLVEACGSLDGGLNRNSSPQCLASFRDSYDRFLDKFPLVFGYWKKYATLEFSIAGPESAVMVYERGCASITNSVDLWTDYCRFKMETTHEPAVVRDLFERAAVSVGLDFLAHPFWDKYIEFEERQESPDRVFAILGRVIHIPMHQYARYYERFRQLTQTRTLAELAAPDVLARLRAEVDAEAAAYPGAQRPELEVERDMRAKIDAMYYDVFTRTQTETSKRWTYESEITRPYFHVAELDHTQLANWRRYLDFEELEGVHARTVFLYERCLVTCALYDEFWFRYGRWMAAQDGKEEEVRNIYQRAATVFVPVGRPGIRLQYAHFEESVGRPDVAREIHLAILLQLPDCVEAIVSLAHQQRRHGGLEAAIEVLKQQINEPAVGLFTKAALVTEWAALVWRAKGSAAEAREVFSKNVEWYADSLVFWEKWLDFELGQPTSAELEPAHADRVRDMFGQLRAKSRLSAQVKRRLHLAYMAYLQERGGKDAMKQFLVIDREMFGPQSVSAFGKTGAGSGTENGALPGELDEATRFKAETRYRTFFQTHVDPILAVGSVPFQ